MGSETSTPQSVPRGPALRLGVHVYAEQPLFDRGPIARLHEVIRARMPAWAAGLCVARHDDARRATPAPPTDGGLADAIEREAPARPGFGFRSVVLRGAYRGLTFRAGHCDGATPAELNCLSAEVDGLRTVERTTAPAWAAGFIEAMAAALPVRYARVHAQEEFDAKNLERFTETGADGSVVTGTRAVGVRLSADGLPGLYWLNFFGPPYVARIGSERLRSAPAPIVRQVGDGVLIGLADSPSDWATPTYRSCEHDVLAQLGAGHFFQPGRRYEDERR